MEGPAAEYGCLFYGINCQAVIARVGEKKEEKLSITTCGSVGTTDEDGQDVACFGKIHLLLRNDHYDVLYLNDDVYSATKEEISPYSKIL